MLLLQWGGIEFFQFIGVLVYGLFFIASVAVVYLLIRFLIAGRKFFEMLTAYFQEKAERDREKSPE